jgi:uncharacterized protein YjiK
MIRAGVAAASAAGFIGLLSGTAPAQSPDAPELRLVNSSKIADRSRGFSEPSGIALAFDGAGYWSVSDDTAAIFRLTPEGRLLPDQSIPLRMKGLEAVVEDPARNRLLVVREDTAEIAAVGLGDGLFTLHPLERMVGFDGIAGLYGAIRSNNGLEGITLDTATGEVVVLKENGPRLMIRISADLSTILGVVALSENLGFACDGTDDVTLDVSDLTWDAARKAFWILSDEGACVFLFDPGTGLATAVSLPGSADHPHRHPKNPEGIALNSDGNELRIVTDDGKDSRLFILSIDGPSASDSMTPDP